MSGGYHVVYHCCIEKNDAEGTFAVVLRIDGFPRRENAQGAQRWLYDVIVTAMEHDENAEGKLQ